MRKYLKNTLAFLLIAFCVTAFIPADVHADGGLTVKLSGKAQYNLKVVLTWPKAASADGYDVYRDGKKVKTVAATSSSTMSCKVRSLKKGKKHSFYVVAYKDNEGSKQYGSKSNTIKLKAKWRQPKVLIVDKKGKNPNLVREMKKKGCKVTVVSSVGKVKVKKYDALIIPGGGDVNPALYGAKRHPSTYNTNTKLDKLQITAIKRFAKAGKPILGICKGHQLINVALGGTLKQNLNLKKKKKTTHRNMHRVSNVKGSWVYKVYGKKPKVFFIHHQAIDELGKGLLVTSWSVGKTPKHIEAIEHETLPIYGVQWHPDAYINKQGTKIFKAFKKVILNNMTK